MIKIQRFDHSELDILHPDFDVNKDYKNWCETTDSSDKSTDFYKDNIMPELYELHIS